MTQVRAQFAPGVNLIGYLESQVGLGEVARKLGGAFEHAGIPVSPIVYRRPPSGEGWDDVPLSGEAAYDTNVVCLNADHLLPFVEIVGKELLARRHTVGVWFWETDVFREQDRRRALFVDEVWVASEYVRRAVAAAVDLPTYVVPVPVEAPPAPELTREQLGLPGGFMFLYVFDFLSAERKNPRGVVDAFTTAFAAGEGPLLVLKSVHGSDRKPDLLEDLRNRVADRPDVLIRDGRVSQEERDAYVATCDCYVSLHRSEGFGLTMAEAMAYGKPVIATGYSGNLDFMSADNAHLVPYRLIAVPETWWAHERGAEWAEPDTEAAAAAMRRLFERPDEARQLGTRARKDLLSARTMDRAAAFVRDRWSQARLPSSASGRAARLALREASLQLSQGPAATLSSGVGRWPAAAIRRALGRALWPYLEEQRRLELSLVEALRALQRSVDDLERRLASVEGARDVEQPEDVVTQPD